jgi:hypothetical protein
MLDARKTFRFGNPQEAEIEAWVEANCKLSNDASPDLQRKPPARV